MTSFEVEVDWKSILERKETQTNKLAFFSLKKNACTLFHLILSLNHHFQKDPLNVGAPLGAES